jgi:glycosyltransferase involved in cell wall biosynthesis
MIYVCVPVHNEARTAGLVLWKVRQVFTDYPREYHLLVCDDGSTDGTPQVLAAYAKVLPMSVVTHRERRGYAKSLEELLRLALQRTDRPKRDCAITLHADFSHPPDVMVEMVRRLESGCDVIVAELADEGKHAHRMLRWVRRWAPRLLRVPGIRDTLSGYVALRLIVWRHAQRADGGPVLTTDGWSANAELLARLLPHARRTETVAAAARYDLAQREPRTTPWRQLVGAWRSRGVIRAARNTVALLLLCALPGFGGGQAPTPAVAVPFVVGERLVYSARMGVFSVGVATLEVAGLDTVRGTETVHFRFHIAGGALWYHLDQTLESWVGRHDFRSRRFLNRTEEKGKRWERDFSIFPDSGIYREAGHDSAHATVADPLDDAAFLYWIRTVPLKVGERYEYQRYFRVDRNPVIVEVLGRDRVNVAGRKWDAIILRPTIPHGGGIFAEKSDARMWLSDDKDHIVLGLQSKFSFGMMTLKLKEYSVPGRP